MIAALHLAALVGYATAWAMHAGSFLRGRPSPDRRALGVTAGGLALHLAGLVALGLGEHTLPLVGLGPASSTLAFAIAVFTAGAAIRPDLRAAGLILLPLVVVLLTQALLVGLDAVPPRLAFRGPWFVLHVGTTFMGFAALAVASAAALMYVLQFRALKRKEFGSVFRVFPSLEALDRLERLGLGIGFPALSLGLLAGWSWTLTFGQPLPPGDPKVVLALVACGAYFAAIVARLAPGWRGQRAAAVNVAAFVATAAVFLLLRVMGAVPPDLFL